MEWLLEGGACFPKFFHPKVKRLIKSLDCIKNRICSVCPSSMDILYIRTLNKFSLIFNEKLVRNVSLKILSIVSHHYFPSFWQRLNSTSEKRRLLRKNTSRPICWHLLEKESAAQLSYVSSIETSDYRTGKCLVNSAPVNWPHRQK